MRQGQGTGVRSRVEKCHKVNAISEAARADDALGIDCLPPLSTVCCLLSVIISHRTDTTRPANVSVCLRYLASRFKKIHIE